MGNENFFVWNMSNVFFGFRRVCIRRTKEQKKNRHKKVNIFLFDPFLCVPLTYFSVFHGSFFLVSRNKLDFFVIVTQNYTKVKKNSFDIPSHFSTFQGYGCWMLMSKCKTDYFFVFFNFCCLWCDVCENDTFYSFLLLLFLTAHKNVISSNRNPVWITRHNWMIHDVHGIPITLFCRCLSKIFNKQKMVLSFNYPKK